jgi:YD repeat-containing protein
MDDDDIYRRLNRYDIEKHTLLTGEGSWTQDDTAPYLLRLDTQPELASWLLESGWARSWAVFFSADAAPKALLTHFRRFFTVKAENGREVFFRFYDPVVLRDFLPLLSEEESLFFFGEVKRFVMEDPEGAPLVFDRPEGEARTDQDPSLLVTSKRTSLAAAWHLQLLGQHADKYRDLGFLVEPDLENNALNLQDKSGAKTRLRKTSRGVLVTTGEQREFHYNLTTCKNPAEITDPAGNSICFDVQERENLLYGIRMDKGSRSWVFDYDKGRHLESILYPDDTRALTTHDSHGNLREFTDRNGYTTGFDLDEHERITRIKDANGQETRFGYAEHIEILKY